MTLTDVPNAPLPHVKIEPARDADACVIWLHGLGADGYDFVDTVPSLGLSDEHRIRFLFPHAPKMPVSLNQGMIMPAWYDIRAIDLSHQQDETGILLSQNKVLELVNEVVQSGIPSHKIALVGFSQGGALALHTALTSLTPLAAVAGLSCYLPLHEKINQSKTSINSNIAILLMHGMFDPIVPYWMGQQTLSVLQEAGFFPQWQAYPMAHTICLPQMQALGKWLQQVLYK